MSSYFPDNLPAGDFETLTISSTALGGTAAKLVIDQGGGFRKRAVRAFITVESNPIRIRFDGTSPTASVGHQLASGDYITIDGEGNVANLRMIAVSTDATVMITYFYNR